MIAIPATNLDEQTLQEIRELEKEIGSPLLAFSTSVAEPATLDEEKVQKIKEFEQKKKISLIAVKP